MATKTSTKNATRKTTAKKAAPARATKGTKAAAKKADHGMSQIDAAAKVLAEAGEPMNCKAMVEQMAAKGYWTRPGRPRPRSTPRSSATCGLPRLLAAAHPARPTAQKMDRWLAHDPPVCSRCH